MSVDVKICGITDDQALDAALEAGADYIGFVFYPPSPRYIDPKTARRLKDRIQHRAKSVALFVNPTDEELDKVIETLAPDFIQLHGHESPERVTQIKARTATPIIKAIAVATQNDTKAAADYEDIADIILFDAKPPVAARASLPGGNGLAFDWRALINIRLTDRFMLSGGLNPANVKEAIHKTGIGALDVSSGVELERGKKDPELIRRFLQNARQAERTTRTEPQE